MYSRTYLRNKWRSLEDMKCGRRTIPSMFRRLRSSINSAASVSILRSITLVSLSSAARDVDFLIFDRALTLASSVFTAPSLLSIGVEDGDGGRKVTPKLGSEMIDFVASFDLPEVGVYCMFLWLNAF